LAAGASYNANLDARIPPGLTGPFYVFVQTDRNRQVADNNLANNVAYDATPMVSQFAPPADLIVTTMNPPATGAPGEKAIIQWTVKNQGTNPAVGQWTDAVYLSKDTTWDSNDAVIGRVDHIGDLAVNATYNGTLEAALPAVLPGEYYVIVRTDVRNFVRENDETNNAGASSAKVKLDVTELTLGVAQSATLGFGQERYYKVNAPANETLRFTLDGNRDNKPQQPANELYVRFGLLPSRSAYDFLFNRPYEPDQEIVVPDTQASTYYSLARNAYLPANVQSDPYSIKAEIVPFGITSVSPNRIGDNGQVTITIKGAKFENGATVKLLKGNIVLTAAKMWAVDSATIKTRFLFKNAMRGTYDITIVNSDNKATTFPNAVTIESALQMTADVNVFGTTQPRNGRTDVSNIQIINSGNIDLEYLFIKVHAGVQLNMLVNGSPHAILGQEAIENGVVLVTGTYQEGATTAAFFMRDIAPNETADLIVKLSDFPPNQSFKFRVDAVPLKVANAIEITRQWVEESRVLNLQLGNILPTELATTIHDANLFWEINKKGLIDSGIFYPSDFAIDLLRKESLVQNLMMKTEADDVPKSLICKLFDKIGVLIPRCKLDPCDCKDPNEYVKTCSKKAKTPQQYTGCVMQENTKCILKAFNASSGGGDPCECKDGDKDCKRGVSGADPNEKNSTPGYGSSHYVRKYFLQN
jgi:hypothetical protein